MKTNTNNKFLQSFIKARKAGTPLVAISSFDPEATMKLIQRSISGAVDNTGGDTSAFATGQSSVPLIQWDCINGWQARNKAGQHAIDGALRDDPIEKSISPIAHLVMAMNLPEDSILFVLNGHHYFSQPNFCQALWNLRDEFKTSYRTVAIVGPEVQLPPQLQHDILLLDEPLPNDIELKEVVEELVTSNEVKVSKEDIRLSVDALRGLSIFPAEQSVAMSLSRDGLDIDGLWERKRKLISSTIGLRCYSGNDSFSQIGGCDQIKKFFHGVITGKEQPNVIVFIDEGEKMFSGSSGNLQDSSGVSQDFLGTILTFMEDNECDGVILVGPPGTAKSAVGKATGNEARVPTIIVDLGAMKGGLVGQSETQLRNALKVIHAVGGGKAFFVMTCNKIQQLPPELRRRFTSGVFYFDLPSPEERTSIWEIWGKKYDVTVDTSVLPDDTGWTGAEIRNCCRLAYRQNLSLKEAAEFIVPISQSAPDQVEGLRKQASGAYLSANYPGVYRYSPLENESRANVGSKSGTKKRVLSLD